MTTDFYRNVVLNPERQVQALYCPHYCEENAWHLSGSPLLGSGERVVVVVSNDAQQVAMWSQKQQSVPEIPIVWDYHVWVAIRDRDITRIWDLDSTLGVDVSAQEYLNRTFLGVPGPFLPKFRMMDARDYRERFASDRRHMRDKNGQFVQPPPSWDPIGRGHNLDRFVAMDDFFMGDVVDLIELKRRWKLETR